MTVAVSGHYGMLTGTSLLIGDSRKSLPRFTTNNTSASCALHSIPILFHPNSLRSVWRNDRSAHEFTGSSISWGTPHKAPPLTTPRHREAPLFITCSPAHMAATPYRSTTVTHLSFPGRSSSRSLVPSAVRVTVRFSGDSRLHLTSAAQRRQNHTSTGLALLGVRSVRLTPPLPPAMYLRLGSLLRRPPSIPPQVKLQALVSNVDKSRVRGAPQSLIRVLDLETCLLLCLCSHLVSSISSGVGSPTPFTPPSSPPPPCRLNGGSTLTPCVCGIPLSSRASVPVLCYLLRTRSSQALLIRSSSTNSRVDGPPWDSEKTQCTALPLCLRYPDWRIKKIFLVYIPRRFLLHFSSSLEEMNFVPCFLPMEEDVSLASLPSIGSSFITGCLSCVAVCTGPEDATEITMCCLAGEGWRPPTSHYVTKLQMSDSIGKATSTHPSFVLNSLSSSLEDLSCSVWLIVVAYAFSQRGCMIPSCICTQEV